MFPPPMMILFIYIYNYKTIKIVTLVYYYLGLFGANTIINFVNRIKANIVQIMV